MLNREERRGILWVTVFLIALIGGGVGLIMFSSGVQAGGAGPPRRAASRATGVGLGSLEGNAIDARSGTGFARNRLSIRIVGLEGLSGHWVEEEDPLERGAFIRGLPADREFEIQLTAAGYEVVTCATRTRIGEVEQLGELTLRPLVELSGAVLDGGGQPLPNTPLAARSGTSSAAWQTRADDRGLYSLLDLPPDVYTLEITAPELRATRGLPLDLRRGGPHLGQAVIALPRASVAGRVTVADGSAPPKRVQLGDREFAVAADGAFRAEVDPGRFEARIRGADGEVTHAWCAAPAAELNLALPAPVSLQVELSGAAPEATVWLAVRSVGFPEEGVVLASAWGAASAAGEIARGSIRPLGPLAVLAVSSEGRAAQREIPAADAAGAGHLPLALELRVQHLPRSSTVGPLVPWGEGANAVEVPLTGQMRLGLLPLPWNGAALEVAPAGDALLTVLNESLLARLAGPTPTGESLRLPLAPTGKTPLACRGSIRGPNGEPLAGAVISAWRLGVKIGDALPLLRTAAALSNEEGMYDLPVLGPTDLSFIRVDSPGLGVAFAPGPGPAADFQLDAEASVLISLVDEMGEPLVSTEIHLLLPTSMARCPSGGSAHHPPAPHGWWGGVTSEAGAALLRQLPPGSYRKLALVHGELRCVPVPRFELTNGEKVQVGPLLCYRPRRLAGAVVDMEGQPVAGAAVELSATAHPTLVVAPQQSAADGSFQFAELPPPPYELSVTRKGFYRRAIDLGEPDQGRPLEVELLAEEPPAKRAGEGDG